MWPQTTQQDRNRRIWEEELADFVPRQVLDFHVHLFNDATIGSQPPFVCGGHPLGSYTIEDWRRDMPLVYPGREVSAVCFGLPFCPYDRPANNRYVADQCDGKSLFGLRLFDPHEEPRSVRSDLQSGRFWGIKPYPDYATMAARGLADVEINDMLPPWVMEIVHERKLLVMLHIPRRLRLADPSNQEQLRSLCTRYPQARIVLAHVGRAYYLKNIVGHLDRLIDLPNLYYDLAMLNHPEVFEYLFRTAAQDKILYGTDVPIALAPGKSVEINNQYAYITPLPWELSICDSGGRIQFTSFLYEELRAIRTAVDRLGLGRPFVQAIFHDNGHKLLSGVNPAT